MIIWSGFGFLVAVFFFGSALLCNLLFDARFGVGYYSAHHWTIGIAMLLAAALCTLVAQPLRERDSRTLTDEHTGERVVLHRRRHTLFFIPMHLWAVLLGAAAVVQFAREWVG